MDMNVGAMNMPVHIWDGHSFNVGNTVGLGCRLYSIV